MSLQEKSGWLNGSASNGEITPLLETASRATRLNHDACLPVPNFRFHTAAAAVFTISVICFCVCSNGDFVFDDRRAIVENTDILPETPWLDLFYNDFWGESLESKTSHQSYRPLTILSFRMSYYFGGGLNPPWFHVPNIILHGLISVLLLHVFSICFGGYRVDAETKRVDFTAPRSALLCALLFAVHPIHTESVSANVGRADLLCALIFLLSFLLYIKSCSKDLRENSNMLLLYRPSAFYVPSMFGSMVLCFISVFCKEQGITVLGVCSAYDIMVVCAVDPIQLTGLSKSKHSLKYELQLYRSLEISSKKPWIRSLIKRHIFLIATGLLTLVIRLHVMGSSSPYLREFDNPHALQNGTFIRGLNYNYLYSLHAWLLVHPWWLCCDWSMGCVPVISSCFDLRVFGGVAFWFVVGSLLVICLKPPIKRDQRTLSMALAFIIIPFLPASNVFFRVGFVVAERILYLPSIGFCLLVVLGLRQICAADIVNIRFAQFVITLLLSVFAFRCIQRGSQWRSDIEIFSSAEKVCPLNAKVYYNKGCHFSDTGNNELALENYRIAVELNPGYDFALNNLGNLLKTRGELNEAEELLERAVALRKDFALAWMNLGITKALLKKSAESEICYLTAIRYNPNMPLCFFHLGLLYYELNMHDKAIRAWKNATILRPTEIRIWMNIALVLESIGQYAESIKICKTALKYIPGDARLIYHLANVFSKQRNWQESEKHYLKAIDLNPTESKFYANLGMLYYDWGKYDLAEQYYRKALARGPREPAVQEMLANLYQKLEQKASIENA